jgi:hypothetical protein
MTTTKKKLKRPAMIGAGRPKTGQKSVKSIKINLETWEKLQELSKNKKKSIINLVDLAVNLLDFNQ